MKADDAMNATSAGILKLKNASRGLNVPLDELVSFYRQDLADISAMTELQVFHFIENYLNNYRLNGRPIVAICAKVEPMNIETEARALKGL